MTIVSSIHNPKIKHIRALRQRKAREQSNSFFIEGIQAVSEAIHMQATIECLIIVPDMLKSPQAQSALRAVLQTQTPIVQVSAEVFEALSSKDIAHGIAAVVQQHWTSLSMVQADACACWVALDCVQYPGNLGTILRTADAVGARGVILLGNSTDPYDPLCVRASVGAIFSQQLIRSSIAEFADWVTCHKPLVIGTSPSASIDYREAVYQRPLVLLMGSERNGLSAQEQALCDTVVRIPMNGRRDSLNLAVATSIMLYETLRDS